MIWRIIATHFLPKSEVWTEARNTIIKTATAFYICPLYRAAEQNSCMFKTH